MRVFSKLLSLLLALCFICSIAFSVSADELTSELESNFPANTAESLSLEDTEFSVASILDVPEKPYKIINVVSGIHLYWNAMPNIKKYGVWRSETGRDGTYKWIGNPTTDHFTDVHVQSGTTYYYRITSVDVLTNTHSDKSEAIGITYVSTPDITSRSNSDDGIVLGWQKIDDAAGYAIYRKDSDTSAIWQRVTTINDGDVVNWTDTSVKNKNGTVYKYTIRALAGANSSTLSGCLSGGRTMVRLTGRVFTDISTSTFSAKCTWTTSAYVTGYEIRFISESEEAKTVTIGNYKTGTKTFSDLLSGTIYTIQIRSY